MQSMPKKGTFIQLTWFNWLVISRENELATYEQAGGGKGNSPIFFQNQRSLFQ